MDNAPKAGEKLLDPGLQYGVTGTTKLDFLSLALALVLGTAGLPHILMRFYTVPTAKEARRSVVWAIWLIGIFYLFTLVLGYGAGALVGPDKITARARRANSAAPLLAEALGGPVLLGLIAAVAFATILAVVAGLTITASASFAHDIYANVIKKGEADDKDAEVKVARHHRGRDRRRGDRRRHRGERPEHRVPGGAGVRGRGVGEPADDPLLAVLEAVQHPGRAVEHLRRSGGHDPADRLLAGGVRQADVDVPGRRLRPVPAVATPASCRSRWRSSSATSARCSSKETRRREVRRDGGPRR